MAVELSLSAQRNADNLFREIKTELEQKGIRARTELEDTSVIVHTDEGNASKVKNAVAEAASRFIIEQFELREIAKMLSLGYSYFTPEERVELLSEIKNTLSGKKEDIAGNLFLIRRKGIITRKLLEHFENENKLYLDGFIPFRLKDYLAELEEFVDMSADDYLMHKEYNEFLALLKYFVSMQEPKLARANVIACNNGNYILMDENEKEITDKELLEFTGEMRPGQLSKEDILISSLITIAPASLVIHNSAAGKGELIETLKHIFSGRISLCGGCNLCALGGGGKYLH